MMVTTPSLPDGFQEFDRIGAQLGHLGLYVLPALTIIVGWAETDFGGHGVEWFGTAMPKLFPTMETWGGINLETTTATTHQWLAYTMLALAVVHVAAVAKHRWMDGHDVLHRMTLRHRRSLQVPKRLK